MSGHSLPRDDPQVTSVARRLGITMLQRAWIEDDSLFIQDPYRTYQVPWPASNKTDTRPVASGDRVDTLPHSGSNRPAHPHGGSGPTHASGAPNPPEAASEPPTHAVSGQAGNCQAEHSSADDFTAIPGVGPVTAQKLHDAGFFTYDDLRTTPGILNDLVGVSTADKIRSWLQEHLL
jgi:hypothetical protein